MDVHIKSSSLSNFRPGRHIIRWFSLNPHDLPKVIISRGICLVASVSVGDERGLTLRSLGLLAALLGRFLLLHFLVGHGGQAACYLLDLLTRQLLDNLLGEFLHEESVLSLLTVGGKDRHKSFSESEELLLGSWIK